jgi:carboxymethylenebutenolidase
MTDDIRARAIAAYDAFTHSHLDRRRLMTELAVLAGSTAAASALLASVAASAHAAPLVAEADPRIITNEVTETLETGRKLKVYTAYPRARGQFPNVVVIHENRGLNAHIRDVARRVGVAGFAAVAPDFLTVSGGTPTDEDAARAAIGALDRAATVADGVALVRMLRIVNQRVGVTGFCWGGGMTAALSVAAGDAIDAAVPYYGPAPAPEDAAKVKAAMHVHLASEDPRINPGWPPFEAAAKAAGVRIAVETWPNTQHAFNNDTSQARYDKAAAEAAWAKTLAFFDAHLKGR